MDPIIVLINGIEHNLGDNDQDSFEKREKLFAHYFPDTVVKSFDSWAQGDLVDESYLHRKAGHVLNQLDNLRDKHSNERRYLIFIGHNIGASLIKQILFQASDHERHQWVYWGTLALYLIECPSYLHCRGWERFLANLLTTGRLPFANFLSIVNIFPKALALIEWQFATMRYPFHVEAVNSGSGNEIFNRDSDPWNFQKDLSRIDAVLVGISANIRQSKASSRRGLQDFQKLLAGPNTALGRLGVTDVHETPPDWLDESMNFKYKLWLESSASSVLAITGQPGSGNTYLSSHILHQILIQGPRMGQVCLSFDFSRPDIRCTSERSLATSLVRQMLVRCPSYLKRIQRDDTLSSSSSIKTLLSDQIWRVLVHLLNLEPEESHIFIVLNAVDQCRDPVASKVALLTTVSGLRASLKILMTSTGYEHGIRVTAKRRIEHIVNKRPVWKDSREAILEKVCSGNYTYFSTMMDLDMLEKGNLPSTKAALTRHLMTPGICWERSIRSLTTKMRDSHRERQTINWIYHAARPLSTSELSVALALGPSDIGKASANSPTLEDLAQQVSWDILGDLRDLFGGIMKITEWGVLFVHRKIRQLIAQEDILFADFDATIVRRCLLYLGLASTNVKEESTSESESRERESLDPDPATGLLDYAQLYWTDHYKRQAVATDTVDDEVLRFLIDKSDAARSWATRYGALYDWLPGTKETPLLVATQLHFDRLVFKMLEADPQDLSTKLREAVRVAAHAGHAELLEKLLSKAGGAEVDVLPALCAAATSGQASVIDILFDYLRLHDALGRLDTPAHAENKNPVLLAVSQGNTAVVEKLLSLHERFMITTRDENGRTAVHLASGIGDIDTLRVLQRLRKDEFTSILLPQQADGPDEGNQPKDVELHDQAVESEPDEPRDSTFSTLDPVQMACTSGNAEVFDFLRDTIQEDSHQIEKDYSQLLGLAVKAGSLGVVEKLLEDQFDLQNRLFEGEILQDAAELGYFEILCRLYEKMSKLDRMQTEQLAKKPKADADDSEDNASERNFTQRVHRALDTACWKGHVDIVEFLLDKVQQSESLGEDLMTSAASSGNLDAMKALINKGYKVQGPDGDYNRIMDDSIRRNDAHVLYFLIEQGLESQWNGYESSIHYAARLNHTLCLRQLLLTQRESEIKQLDCSGNSAIDEAVREGSADALEDLLNWDKGATSQTPQALKTIKYALESSYSWKITLRVIRLLLENGWESDRMDTTDQDSALHLAAGKFKDGDVGWQEIFTLLLDHKESTKVDVVNRHGETPLFVACQKGHAGVVGLLLARGANQTLVNKQKRTPLHVALHETETSVVRVLLGLDQSEQRLSESSAKAPVEAPDQDGFRAIHLALQSCDIMELLLSHDPKPDVDAIILDGTLRTALMEAVSDGPFCVVQLLLKHGAQVNVKDDDEWAPLDHTMLRKPHFGDVDKVARHLREHGADVNSRIGAGCTALYLAIRHEKDDVASSLLDAIVEDGHTLSEAANPNIFGGSYHSPLQLAVFRDLEDLVVKLLDRGAEICAQGGAYGSPLHTAMWNTRPELARILLERCVQQKQVTSDEPGEHTPESASCKTCGNLKAKPMGTPLHALCSRPQDIDWPTKEIASLLLQHGADVNARDYSGRTALMLLVLHRHDDHEGARSLIQDLEADSNLKDESGETALHQAVTFAPVELVRVLLDGKADVQALDGLGQTVLSRAASRTESNMFTTVLENIPEDRRADQMADALIPSLKSGDRGKAAFHAIMEHDGVSLNRRDRSGWTAVDVSTAMGLFEEAELLKKKGGKASEVILRPSKLSSIDKEPIVCVSEDGREACMQEFDNCFPPRKVVGIVRADHCIPLDRRTYYFEVTVQSIDDEGAVAIGLVEGNTSLGSLVGWETTSWGFHSDDGSIVVENEVKDTGPTFGNDQIVGVTVFSEEEEEDMKMCFTLDGKRVGDPYTVSGQLFPAISFLQGQSLEYKARINFGPQDGGEDFTYKPYSGLREEPADQATDDEEENESNDEAETG